MPPPIHTDHNLYILGAGFSCDAGLPLISNFLESMRDSVGWLDTNDRRDEAQAIGEVFDFRLKAAATAYRSNIDVENIEELFSLAAASEGEAHTDYVTKAIAATLDVAQRTGTPHEAYLNIQVIHDLPQRWRRLEQAEGANMGGYTHGCPLYHLYSGMLTSYFCQARNGRNTIITFNYDTLIEDSLHDLGVRFHYGLSRDAVELQPSARCQLQGEQDSMPILKLHGSVNWAKPAVANDRIRVYGSYDDLRGQNEQVLLLPPTWRKAFGGRLMGVWETALKSITEATRIIIVGFSMPTTDTHFKYLIASGLRDNVSLRKVVFVNPGFEKEPEKARLRNNLFNVLRPELEQRNLISTVATEVHEFLLRREHNGILQRSISPNYVRIGIKHPDVIHYQY